jgi:hypothetical protein
VKYPANRAEDFIEQIREEVVENCLRGRLDSEDTIFFPFLPLLTGEFSVISFG